MRRGVEKQIDSFLCFTGTFCYLAVSLELVAAEGLKRSGAVFLRVLERNFLAEKEKEVVVLTVLTWQVGDWFRVSSVSTAPQL
jgi:hypothetical protein